jgi:hypothetical protein
MIFDREPALILGALGAIITLVTAFGLDLTAEQVAGINAAAVAVLSVIVRAKVSPVDR